MLSRLFLIPILLLVGITTVAIGAPVAETIESIKAFKIPQIRSGNLTLNRRFIPGVPGLPQCPDDEWPILISSFCLNERMIQAICESVSDEINDRRNFYLPCPVGTYCMNFITAPGAGGAPPFALCIDESFAKNFNNNKKGGIVCKTFKLNGVTNDQATLSVNVYDGTANPVQVLGVGVDYEGQTRGSHNTNSLSSIVNVNKNNDPIKVCVNIAVGVYSLYNILFSFLDGTYSSS